MKAEDIQDIADFKQRTAIHILEKLKRNEHVSRWDVLRNSKRILILINMWENYSELEDEVLSLIESAKESL